MKIEYKLKLLSVDPVHTYVSHVEGNRGYYYEDAAFRTRDINDAYTFESLEEVGLFLLQSVNSYELITIVNP